jgi:hypothetical protein
VRKHFEQLCFGRGAAAKPVFDAFDESHGRLVRRRVFADPQAALLERSGTGRSCTPYWRLRRSERLTAVAKYRPRFATFSLASLAGSGHPAARHWSIENSLHWVLDVSGRMIAARPHSVPYYAKSPSTWWVKTAPLKPASVANAKKRHATTTTCSNFSKPISCVSPAYRKK